MKRAITFLGVAGACAACCTVPLLLPILGASALGAAWLSPEFALGVAAIFVLASLAVGISRQRKAKGAATHPCGCSSVPKAGQ